MRLQQAISFFYLTTNDNLQSKLSLACADVLFSHQRRALIAADSAS